MQAHHTLGIIGRVRTRTQSMRVRMSRSFWAMPMSSKRPSGSHYRCSEKVSKKTCFEVPVCRRFTELFWTAFAYLGNVFKVVEL